MISFLISAIKIIFVLGFIILIHEGGHFLVARLCKIKVNDFSIGFGPIIWKKQGKDTRYTLRLIPLGGFVNLEGEEQELESEGSFSKASIPKRLAVVLAGGLVNIIFAIIVYFILMTCVGNNTSTTVEKTIDNYAASKYGIIQNDQIVKINNKNINTKKDLDNSLKESQGQEITLILKRNNEQKEIKLVPTKQEYKNTGIYLKGQSQTSTKIISLVANSPAEKQGLQANDEILKINDTEVKNQLQIIDQINNIQTQNIKFTIKRNNEVLDIEITPEIMANYYLGVELKKAEDTLFNNLYYATFSTKDFVISMVDNLKTLFTGNIRANQLMGPVGISEVVAKTSEFKDYIYILALISLSLGVTNLLPFPALDGGKIVLLLIEAIRKKKLSQKTEINIQLIGFAILIILSVYITYNDILRIL